MLTGYKKKDLKDLIEGNHDLHNTFSLIGDKLRTIYVSLGWDTMLKDFSDVDNIIEEVTTYVLNSLEKNQEDISYGTAGLEVRGYFDEEGMLNLDYNFHLA